MFEIRITNRYQHEQGLTAVAIYTTENFLPTKENYVRRRIISGVLTL
jgi:hypothetical protein